MPGITNGLNRFQSLVEALSEKLGPCSGINSDDVDETELQQLMADYISNESEWAKYFFPSSSMPYTRNLVDKGNGKSNLVYSQVHCCWCYILTGTDDSSVVARQGEPHSRVSFLCPL
jgi:hypothetical protein